MDEVRRQEISQRLEEIRKANGGSLTAEAVVKDAKDKASPLHDEFEWRVKDAAYQHWLDTARQIIRSYRVTITEDVAMRAPRYVRDPRLERGQQGYVSLYELRTDEDAAAAAMLKEFQRIESAIHRALGVAEVLGLRDWLNDMLDQILTAKSRVKKAA